MQASDNIVADYAPALIEKGRGKIRLGTIGFATWFNLIVVIAYAVLTASLFRQGHIVGFGDNLFDVSPRNELLKSFPAWSHRTDYFGAVDDGASWAAWLLVLWPLERAFGASIAQAVTLWLFVSGSHLLFRAFLQRLNFSPAVATAGGFAYAINPLTLLLLNNNYPLEAMLVLMPAYGLVFCAASRFGRARRKCTLGIAALSAFALPMLDANPALLALFLLGAICIHLAIWSIFRPTRGYVLWLLKAAFIALCASAWWLLPSIVRYVSVAHIANTNAASYAWVVARADLLNVMRLNALWEWGYSDYYPFAAGFDSNALLYGAGFFLVSWLFIGCIALNTRREKRRLILPAIGAIIALFLSKGLHPPFVWLSTAFYHLPGAFLFREPTFKFGALAIFDLVFVFAVVLQAIVRLRSFGNYALVACCVVCGLSWAPALSGQIFRGSSGPAIAGEVGLPSTYYAIPRYWRDVAAYTAAHDRSAGVFVLPVDSFYDRDYSWGLYGADYLPMWLLPNPVWTVGTSMYTASSTLQAFNSIATRLLLQQDSRLPILLKRLGVRYVLLRRDVVPRDAKDLWLIAISKIPGSYGRRITFGPLTIIDLGAANPPVTQNADDSSARGIRAPWYPEPPLRQRPARAKDFGRLPNSSVRPAFIWAYEDQYGALNIRVLNSTANMMHANLSIGALTSHTEPCTLSHLRWHQRAVPPQPSLAVRLLAFHDVPLVPGFNGLSLSCGVNYLAGRMENDAGPIRRGAIYFNAASISHKRKRHASQMYGQRTPVFSVRLHVAARDVVPGLMLRLEQKNGGAIAPGPDRGVLLEVRDRDALIRCYAALQNGRIAVDLAVASCLQHVGVNDPLGASVVGLSVIDSVSIGRDADSIRATWMESCPGPNCWLYSTSVNHGSVRDAGVRHDSTSATFLLPGGVFKADTPVKALAGNSIAGVATAVHLTSRGAVVATRDAYSDTWRAYQFRGVLPQQQRHIVVDGWRNGWVAQRAGLLIILNDLVLLQFVLLFGSSITLAAMTASVLVRERGQAG